ncbi:MAG: hypothetical protein LBS69_08515 [Prevotellaceae bacterium]|nr:hypothetical protein [Prevotellaceae bacterium]
MFLVQANNDQNRFQFLTRTGREDNFALIILNFVPKNLFLSKKSLTPRPPSLLCKWRKGTQIFRIFKNISTNIFLQLHYIVEIEYAYQSRHNVIESRYNVIENRHNVVKNRYNVVESRYNVAKSRYNVVENRHNVAENRYNVIKIKYENNV